MSVDLRAGNPANLSEEALEPPRDAGDPFFKERRGGHSLDKSSRL